MARATTGASIISPSSEIAPLPSALARVAASTTRLAFATSASVGIQMSRMVLTCAG